MIYTYYRIERVGFGFGIYKVLAKGVSVSTDGKLYPTPQDARNATTVPLQYEHGEIYKKVVL